jgi:S1-C subfamily serine protease
MTMLSFISRTGGALCVLGLLSLLAGPAAAGSLPQTIASVKQSIVAVATFQKTRSPSLVYRGTGFAAGDGLSVITNAHVVPATLDEANREVLGIVIGIGPSAVFRQARMVAEDKEHDLAHLRVGGTPLPAMKLADSDKAMEGQEVAFTGFPLGMMLGPYHVTHRAMISSIAPIVLPARNASKLDAKAIAQLKAAPFKILQLDGTAYPGNSGSPLYDPQSGEVFGVINMVLVKGIKEAAAISHPSGITYAIPSSHVKELLERP